MFIFVLVLSVFRVQSVVRNVIDENCSAEFPVYGRPIFETGEARCMKKVSFVDIMYPFQSYSFREVNQNRWIPVCGVSLALKWGCTCWQDYDLDKLIIINNHLLIRVPPQGTGQLFYIQDCYDRHLLFRTWGPEKCPPVSTTAMTSTKKTTTTTTTSTTTTTTMSRTTKEMTKSRPSSTATTTTATTTTTTTITYTTPKRLTKSTTATTTTAATTSTTKTTSTASGRSTRGQPNRLYMVYGMVGVLLLAGVVAMFVRFWSISMRHPTVELIELERLIQIKDKQDDAEEDWVDVNRGAVYYRKLINNR